MHCIIISGSIHEKGSMDYYRRYPLLINEADAQTNVLGGTLNTDAIIIMHHYRLSSGGRYNNYGIHSFIGLQSPIKL